MCLGLFIGCAAKSAQVPLHTWLPDAMEGPTPVSALIHAATMVTAGVYLIARCAPLWNASSDARMMVGSIGALTAITGAILGCGQWDIKRILAYSTMSQIGYMIMGVGVGAFDAGILHFLTHAFFKAQLFLGAGIIIHNLANEQDVRKMGGLRKQMPFAFAAMTIGVLSICGIPGFAGFFSKDAISERHARARASGDVGGRRADRRSDRVLHVPHAVRHVLRRVSRQRRSERTRDAASRTLPARETAHPHEEADHGHAHAPAWLMSGPVALLMIPSVLIGWLDFGGENSPWGKFFAPVFGTFEPTASTPPEVMTSLLVLARDRCRYLHGIPALRQSEGPDRKRFRGCSAKTMRMPAALTNAFYFDAAIDALFVKPTAALGGFFRRVIDPHVIDAGVREAAISSQWLGHLFRSFQTGLVRAYALALAFGAACFALYYVVIGAGK